MNSEIMMPVSATNVDNAKTMVVFSKKKSCHRCQRRTLCLCEVIKLSTLFIGISLTTLKLNTH
jgi:hypothetical protein